MPPLSELGKYKILAELYVLAMKLDPVISVQKNDTAINCLMDYGLTERQAESFLNAAFGKLDRGMMRDPDALLDDVSTMFRRREHTFILSQVQSILEAGEITNTVQEFYNLCCEYLYHEG